MSTSITGSPDIATLDAKVIADLCVGKFFVDVSPSTFLGSGAANVLGASVKITNPNGVVVKPHATGHDIAPPMTGVVSFDIPTESGGFQQGEYQIEVRLTDAGGVNYSVTKLVVICKIHNSHGKEGEMFANMRSSCRDGKFFVSLNSIPSYNGMVTSVSTRSLKLWYPTSSGRPATLTTSGSFSTVLFEGVYKLEGQVCATYTSEHNIYYKVKYIINTEKEARCSLDECSVFNKLAEISAVLKGNCSQARIEDISNTTLDALRLYHTAKLGQECGEDVTDYINELESLLGCKCNIEANEGMPVMGNNAPARDFVIEGCNVEQTVSGFTTTYKINNFEYIIDVEANGGVLTATAPTLAGCVKTQKLSFNIQNLYAQVKQLAANDKAFWTGLITVGGKSLAQFLTDMQNQIDQCCSSEEPMCAAVITANNATQANQNVVIGWTQTGAVSVQVFIDGASVPDATVAAPANSFAVVGGANGMLRTYKLVPVCGNGELGSPVNGTFQFSYCPPIALPTVLNASLTAPCPYDLANNVGVLAAGTTAEWHTANNTLLSTLVDNPAQVGAGTYYLFAKDANGCYSAGTAFALTCELVCTAPKNVTILSTNGTTPFRISFQTPDVPPANNSYSVQRKLLADADAPANWTIVGAPVWNAVSSRWEITDNTAINNTQYTYRLISNCSVTHKPSVDVNFENNVTVCTPVTGVSATIHS